ncbi:MAG TPA: DUF3106 domain-containing protein [Verrucomicrobiae bacterium]|jgi:hypothetical protein
MRSKTLQLCHLWLLLPVLAAATAGAQTNDASAPLHRAPPWPWHWYQDVGHGVTVTNLTPVAYFRGLLGMTPVERERMLAGQSEQRRAQVLAKIHEYEALPKDVREERMRQTELHWYVLNLLRLSPGQRQEQMKDISPLYHPMILARLMQWDQLPEAMRKSLLEKEGFMRTYVQWQGHSPAAQEEVLAHLPAEQRGQWAQELNRWQGLNGSQREELSEAFRQFFGMSGEERKETVQSLSESERQQMEHALRSYASLPPGVQRQCVESFSKFATMSAGEQNQFLRNATKWESMTPRERQLWRTLVNKLPPLPPGVNQAQPPLPPGMPPWPKQTAAGATSVTNVASAR